MVAKINVDTSDVGRELMMTERTKATGWKNPPSICLAAVFLPTKMAGISEKAANETADNANMANEIFATKSSHESL